MIFIFEESLRQLEEEIRKNRNILIQRSGDASNIENLRRDEINHLRIQKTLDPALKDVLICVLMLFEQTELNIDGIRKFLAQPNLVSQMKQWDPSDVPQTVLKRVNRFIKNKDKSFDRERMKYRDLTGVHLIDWINGKLNGGDKDVTFFFLE